ncbi:MAG TPA: hypothetical protein ENI60_00400 [Candidatus Fraserbacteria bacterium]|nr:hypothetical protein [Candidatus Fraserbacteria bacterium]
MKLLFDQNLSHRLVSVLASLYPGSVHVRDLGLKTADDDAVWKYALEHGFTIASKDADFRQRSFLFSHPPKVVWIRLGNCSTQDIEALLRARHGDLLAKVSIPFRV